MKWLRNFHRSTPLQIQLFTLGLTPCLPLLFIIYLQIQHGPLSPDLMAVFFFCFGLWFALHALVLWRACHDPFYTLANLVRSLRQGDYSQRMTEFPRQHAIGYLHKEINSLADLLQNNRLSILESNRRFQYLIDLLEIGVVIFDDQWRVTLINKHLARLLRVDPGNLPQSPIDNLALQSLREAATGRTQWLNFPQRTSRYLIHTHDFRNEGRPQKLFLLTDVNSQLREEERLAWKRIIRVLGHELNNSLTPIISLSHSLKSRFRKFDIPANQRESTIDALDVIANRADGMNRFVSDYAKLAKLPEPHRQSVPLPSFFERIDQLLAVPSLRIDPGPACSLMVDPTQIEQALINIIHNASHAIPENGGEINLSWRRQSTDAIITIEDNGPGIEKLENLFVPFYSTKPGGSGIGLVLSRQITESNGGAIELSNREAGGCRVTLRLPLDLTA